MKIQKKNAQIKVAEKRIAKRKEVRLFVALRKLHDKKPLAFQITLLVLMLILVLIYILLNDWIESVLPSQLVVVISTLFGVTFPLLGVSTIRLAVLLDEDYLKIDEKMVSIYSSDYDHKLITKNTKSKWNKELIFEQDFKYNPCFCNTKNKKFKCEVKDSLNYMSLDDFLIDNAMDIIAAHDRSDFKNADCVRLRDFEIVSDPDSEKLVLYTQRTTYFNSMLTNRAMDFRLSKVASVRKLYEYRPYISELKHSKMSNHLGINAISVLTDGNVIVAVRSSKGTQSKGKYLSSIAYPFEIGEIRGSNTYGSKDISKNEIDDKDLFDTSVRYLINKKISARLESKYGDKIGIRFLGFGQDLYEGGKPQMYFALEIPLDTDEYLDLVAHEDRDRDDLDHSIGLYVCRNFSINPKKEWTLDFERRNPKTGRYKHMSKKFERSFFANLYHYLYYYRNGNLDCKELKSFTKIEVDK